MYSRALAVALVLILGTTLSEVDARALSDQSKEPHFPDTIATCIHNYFRSFAPTMGKMIEEIGRSHYMVKLRAELNDMAKPIINFLKDVDKEIAEEMEMDKKKKKKHPKEHKELQQEAQ
ncbi:hypothetical protein NDU88_001053 [Pleurodeles waltl]|uniref:Uncharacterized protein n=1 Tax=Pleurodeles waltl TaxID=8319 RepID=A0AAV7NCC6_PLEWA|nr:hypothetical protein NDU88_001053 [Pleurodeles waltl]